MSHYPNTNERGLRHNAGNAPLSGSGTFGENPASGPAPTTAGHHKHDLLNKLDPRVDSTRDRAPAQAVLGNSNNNNIPTGTYGPHSSRIANALDPRVDSDLDGRGQRGGGMMSGGGMGGGGGGMVGGMTGAGAGAASYGSGAPEGTYGPHSSRMANALDPRVDSDRDGRGAGGHQTQEGYPHSGTAGGYGQPVGGGVGHGHGHHSQQQYAPQQQYGQQQVGYGGMGSGPGPAPNTAGPHKSDLLNKLDPRVDSKTGMMKDSGYSERRGI